MATTYPVQYPRSYIERVIVKDRVKRVARVEVEQQRRAHDLALDGEDKDSDVCQ